MLASGTVNNKRAGLRPWMMNELLRPTLSETVGIRAILADREPRRMSLLWLEHNPLPPGWEAQRGVMTRFDA